MAIPKTFSTVKRQDFTLTPIKVHKRYSLTNSDLATTASGYYLQEGYYSGIKTPIGDPRADNDPTNSIDNSFKHVIWHSINHRYYKDAYNPYTTLEHWNERYTYKNLSMTASIIAIPYLDYGERIKPESVTITNPGLGVTLIDDGNGNLYDSASQVALPYLERQHTSLYMGFNEEFRRFKRAYGLVSHGDLKYKSSLFAPDDTATMKNVTLVDGVVISGSECGMAAKFNTGTNRAEYILVPNNNAYNYDAIDEFTISCWLNISSSYSASDNAPILTKRGVKWTDTFGMQDKLLASGITTRDRYISSSYIETEIDRYPYDLSLNDGLLYFKRSDGIRQVELSQSFSEPGWQHVSISRYESGSAYHLRMVCNGINSQTKVDTTDNPMNNHAVMIGAHNFTSQDQFSGSIDEIRFVNKAYMSGSHIDSTFYSNLASSSYAFNTAVVGNVFYRSGNIVLTPHDNKYNDMFSGSYTIDYRGTHTIYQYEVLCRIKKGDFNLTLNPTARKSPKSDLLINEMTGSLLKPYFTSIGLYNDTGDLLGVAKMGQAIKVRDDVDVNILIQFDG